VKTTKLDPRLLALLAATETSNPPEPAPGRGLRMLAARQPARRVGRLARPAIPPATAARVFLESTGTATLDFPHGATTVSKVVNGLWTATVPLDEVRSVAGHRGVRRMTLARRLRPLLDKALARVHVPEFRTAHGLTGAGVIVGVIDSGIDARHPSFAGRVLRVWDQTRRGEGVPEGAYGLEFTGASLTRSRDRDGHGTHVAGIAAGAHPQYGGVAPGASLVIVRTTMEDTDIADAVRYVFRVAQDQNAPAVINISLGGHDDGHDGTDPLCRVIDEASGAGRIVCCAAGNEGDDNIHGATTVTRHGDAGMRFHVPAGSVAEASLTGWYGAASRLEVAVRTPDGKLTPFQAVVQGAGSATRTYDLAGTHIVITTPGPDPSNGDYNFRVTLRSTAKGSKVRQGIWQLRLRLASGRAAAAHVWAIDDAEFPEVAFTGTSREDAMKVGSPGSASRAITVGCFTSRTRWIDRAGDEFEVGYAAGRITSFSSEGPLRNGGRKPEVTAPGAIVGSAYSRYSSPDAEDVVSDDTVMMSGTSMASPFVAGLIALLLERNPGLTPEQAKRRLKAVSRIPGRRPGTFDTKWGYGLVDATRL
jgi:subtilisin family serine protease